MTDPGLWNLCLLAAAAAVGVGLAEEAARHAPAALEWQQEDTAKVHRRATWQTAIGAVAAAAATILWSHDLKSAAAVAAAAVLTFHLCATDMRDRWLPEYATLPLLVLGLLASPGASLQSRVDAMVLNGALVTTWQIMMPIFKRRKVTWDDFSGGDQVLGAAAGAWLGMGAGQRALCVAAAIGCISMTMMPRTDDGPGGRLARLMGFDPETRTFPFGVYIAAGLWFTLMSEAPGL